MQILQVEFLRWLNKIYEGYKVRHKINMVASPRINDNATNREQGSFRRSISHLNLKFKLHCFQTQLWGSGSRTSMQSQYTTLISTVDGLLSEHVSHYSFQATTDHRSSYSYTASISASQCVPGRAGRHKTSQEIKSNWGKSWMQQGLCFCFVLCVPVHTFVSMWRSEDTLRCHSPDSTHLLFFIWGLSLTCTMANRLSWIFSKTKKST